MSFNWFEGRIGKLKKDNKGMALITVIVVIGFVAALVSIVLTTSLVNFKMKRIETQSKDTFYSAEQALDEINVFLQKVVSDSMSSAYLDIMNNYSTYDSQTKSEMLQTKYFENIWAALGVEEGGTIKRNQYDVKKLEDWLKASTVWHGDAENGYGAIVVATHGKGVAEDKAGNMVTYQNSGVVLEGLKVYYKDPKGFVSIVQTDIRLSYPDFDFAASSELPSLPYYSIIADKQAKIDSNNSVQLTGNVYANQLSFKGGTRAGESINRVAVELGDADTLTVKYDIDIKPYVDLKSGSNAEIWANNIVVDTSTVELDGTIQVANDLNLKGTNPTAKISGEYVGFGNSITDGAKSSAILINGKGTTLDMSNVDKITVAGHGFIGTSDSQYDEASAKYNNPEAATGSGAKNNDFLMGEALAVKSDQLMYLVPPEAVGVDERTNRSLYGKNPLTFNEYKNLMDLVANTDDTFDYVEVSNRVEIASLGTDLSEYMATKKSGDDYVAAAEKVFVRVNDEGAGGGLVYFYLKFTNVSKAEKFFIAYYNNNKEAIAQYMDFYLNEMKIHNLESLTTAATAGPIIKGNKNDVDGFEVEVGTKRSESDYIQKLHDKYYKKYKSMCTNLVSTDNTVSYALKPVGFANSFDDDENIADNQVVFENIVNETLLQEFVDSASGSEAYNNIKVEQVIGGYNAVEVLDDGPEGTKPYAIVSYDPNYDVDISTDVRYDNLSLVICKGNVTISRPNFRGLVICDGVVSVTASDAVVEANPGAIRKILAMGYLNTAVSDKAYTVARVLREGNEFIYSSLDPKGDTANLALGGLITYENWRKE